MRATYTFLRAQRAEMAISLRLQATASEPTVIALLECTLLDQIVAVHLADRWTEREIANVLRLSRDQVHRAVERLRGRFEKNFSETAPKVPKNVRIDHERNFTKRLSSADGWSFAEP